MSTAVFPQRFSFSTAGLIQWFLRWPMVDTAEEILEICIFHRILEFHGEFWRKFGSNINDVIRTILNFLIYFLRKDFSRTKSTKRTQGIKSLKKHQKALKAQKHNQVKAQNASKQTKIKNALKKSKWKKVIYSLICVSVLAKKEIRKSLQWKCWFH